MTPQERQVIDGIFERLKGAANQPRDAEVERYIADLIRQQPYAPYAMAQSVYVQEQALLNQQQQIEQLQAENAQLQQKAAAAPPASGGFLSGLFGGGAPAPRQPEPPAYGQRPPQQGYAPQGMPPQQGYAPQPAPPAGPWGQPQQPPQQRQGMGFLGTAAAAAAGVAGGMMLSSALSGAFGGGSAQAAAPRPNQLSQEPSGSSGEAYGADEAEEGYSGDDSFGGGDDSYDA